MHGPITEKTCRLKWISVEKGVICPLSLFVRFVFVNRFLKVVYMIPFVQSTGSKFPSFYPVGKKV